MRILLALDGSPSSIDARDLVASVGWAPGTAITLLSVYELPSAWPPEGPPSGDWIREAGSTLHAQALDALAESAAPLEGRGWSVEWRADSGRPATAIMAAADELDADLIVLGSRGRGPIRTMLLGSVSAEVADRAHQSVLVARGPRVSRALVATDGSEGSSLIPDVLASWAALRDVPAVVLSVASLDSPVFEALVSLYTAGSRTLEGERTQALARHEGFAADAARRLSAGGMTATPEVRSGDPADVIIETAKAHGVDLIVTASAGLRGRERWLLGSVSRNVLLHAEASVLTLRPRVAEPAGAPG